MGVVVEPFGDAALRARLPEGAPTRAVLDALRALDGVVDAVVTERHALVTFDPRSAPRGIADAISRAMESASEPAHARDHVVRVRYDGADLYDVAGRAGLSRDEAIERHAAGRYVVAAIGFLPGFAYLRGLDARLEVPRRANPRPRIPERSVAIAGPYTGVYPFASPGGWNLVGTAVDFCAFDAATGAALALGDRVRFERAS